MIQLKTILHCIDNTVRPHSPYALLNCNPSLSPVPSEFHFLNPTLSLSPNFLPYNLYHTGVNVLGSRSSRMRPRPQRLQNRLPRGQNSLCRATSPFTNRST